MAIVVDDMIVASNNPKLNVELYTMLCQKFRVKDLGFPEYVLGMHVQRLTKHHIKLSQKLYIQKMADKYLETKFKTYTPMLSAEKLTADMCGSKTGSIDKPYRNLIGALLYVVLTRPDIAVAVSILAQFSEDPGIKHWEAAQRLLRYLSTTADLCLDFKPALNMKVIELKGNVDAGFDSCPTTSRSRTGYYLSLCGCLLL